MIINHYIKLIIIFSLIFSLGCNNNGTSPPSIPKLSLSISTSKIAVGDTLTIDVRTINIENYGEEKKYY